MADSKEPVQAATKEPRIPALLRHLSPSRFKAQIHGESVLPSTVAVLRAKGHIVVAIWEPVPTRYGHEVRVKRYQYIEEL